MAGRIAAIALVAVMTVGLAACASTTTTGAAQAVPASLQSRADHEAVATRYEEEAKAAAARVTAHRRMLLLYTAPYPDYSASGLVGHCKNMIDRYSSIERDALAMAAIHRNLAARLP